MHFKELEERLGVAFHDTALLKTAFTHSSYVNEHPQDSLADNERLEFLGDAVLELGVSQFLYLYNEHMPEGELTKLRAAIVCEASLVHFARDLHFENYMLLGHGEEQSGGRERPALLADAFEAFLGALYLDQGYDAAIHFMEKHIFPKIQSGVFSHGVDYKSQLQELVQQYKKKSIEYRIAEEKGPSHDKEFVSEVRVQGHVEGTGTGRTKKEAEQRAAKRALDAYMTKA